MSAWDEGERDAGDRTAGEEGDPPAARGFAPGKRALTGTMGSDAPGGGPLPSPGKVSLTHRLSRGSSRLPYREDMERTFGENLAGVSAHLGESAALAEHGAAGAARGETVAFASHRPSPEVVAHEVAHVIQGRRAGEKSGAGDRAAAEADADAAARNAMSGAPVAIGDQAPAGWAFKDQADPPVAAADYVHHNASSIHLGLLHGLRVARAVEQAQDARFVRDHDAFLVAIHAAMVPNPSAVLGRLPGLLAPESMATVVDRGRHRQFEKQGTAQVEGPLGPRRFDDAVTWELVIEIGKRLAASIPRSLGRFVSAHAAGWSRDAVRASHPVDSAVIEALYQPTVSVDVASYREARPAMDPTARMRPTARRSRSSSPGSAACGTGSRPGPPTPPPRRWPRSCSARARRPTG